MDIVSLLIGLAVAFIAFKLIKGSIKLLINGVVGVILLWIVNFVGASFGITIGINIFTALIAGIFGIPGVIVMVVFKLVTGA
ncbi:pro-sigmaK processing inhibitor BofA family protein [uncultured Clostridium sp.]|jgi:inhibitor of the pro-sigma K processing machinery|uniref:pro-sigmaK processing inhibitor BofA family protein n=1 Tax=uncultured Clostridium sp. TaxID=59620 RepID=UPI002622E7AD|nr:pro-sigmaK processing inhibitor BofA family protein [uncultured Clostridium sp.]